MTFIGDILANPKVKQKVVRIIESIVKWKHWELLELNVQDDHIHMILITPPNISMSYVMQMIEGKSSAWLKKKIKNKHGIYEKHSMWARGYFVSSIGIDEIIVRRYVRYQAKHNQIEQPSLFEKI